MIWGEGRRRPVRLEWMFRLSLAKFSESFPRKQECRLFLTKVPDGVSRLRANDSAFAARNFRSGRWSRGESKGRKNARISGVSRGIDCTVPCTVPGCAVPPDNCIYHAACMDAFPQRGQSGSVGPGNGGMRYGADSSRERHDDRGGPSSDTACRDYRLGQR